MPASSRSSRMARGGGADLLEEGGAHAELAQQLRLALGGLARGELLVQQQQVAPVVDDLAGDAVEDAEHVRAHRHAPRLPARLHLGEPLLVREGKLLELDARGQLRGRAVGDAHRPHRARGGLQHPLRLSAEAQPHPSLGGEAHLAAALHQPDGHLRLTAPEVQALEAFREGQLARGRRLEDGGRGLVRAGRGGGERAGRGLGAQGLRGGRGRGPSRRGTGDEEEREEWGNGFEQGPPTVPVDGAGRHLLPGVQAGEYEGWRIRHPGAGVPPAHENPSKQEEEDSSGPPGRLLAGPGPVGLWRWWGKRFRRAAGHAGQCSAPQRARGRWPAGRARAHWRAARGQHARGGHALARGALAHRRALAAAGAGRAPGAARHAALHPRVGGERLRERLG